MGPALGQQVGVHVDHVASDGLKNINKNVNKVLFGLGDL